MEKALTTNQIVAMLTRSPHGELEQYAPIAMRAANENAGFYAHLVAWNERNGSIRDAKVALPVLALTSSGTVSDPDLRDNALAHLAKLDPRNLLRAVRFAKGQPVQAKRMLYRLVERYMREREASPGRFDRVALQHRKSLVELYALLHIKPSEYANGVLFAGKKDGIFGVVASLKDMDPAQAAGTIMERRIPFLVAQGAMGAKMKDPAVVQALIEVMSPTELVTNMNALKKLGVETNPVLRGALEKALARTADTKSTAATLKTTKAAEAIGGVAGERLKAVQEKQLDKMAVKGDWLVLADRSPSMAQSIELARQVSGVLARVAEGNVHLVFFDSGPEYYNVTGKSYEEIVTLTKSVTLGGGTSCGVGLKYAKDRKIVVDGVVLISDGGENTAPMFAPAFKAYEEFCGKDLPLYYYLLKGDLDQVTPTLKASNIECQTFDMTHGKLDYYSLPNIVATMRASMYDLSDEINATPLLTLADVFKLAEA